MSANITNEQLSPEATPVGDGPGSLEGADQRATDPGSEVPPDNASAASSAQPSAPSAPDAAAPPRRLRGFAAMDKRQVAEIARKGGRAAHIAGTAHEFTSDEARLAGRRGGLATHANRRRPKAPSPNG